MTAVKMKIEANFELNENVQIPYVNGWITLPIKSFLVKNNKVYATFEHIRPVELSKLKKL